MLWRLYLEVLAETGLVLLLLRWLRGEIHDLWRAILVLQVTTGVLPIVLYKVLRRNHLELTREGWIAVFLMVVVVEYAALRLLDGTIGRQPPMRPLSIRNAALISVAVNAAELAMWDWLRVLRSGEITT